MSLAQFNPLDGMPLDDLRARLEAAQKRLAGIESENAVDRAFERGFLAGDGAMTTACEATLNALIEGCDAEIEELMRAIRQAEATEEDQRFGWDGSYADWRRDQRR